MTHLVVWTSSFIFMISSEDVQNEYNIRRGLHFVVKLALATCLLHFEKDYFDDGNAVSDQAVIE